MAYRIAIEVRDCYDGQTVDRKYLRTKYASRKEAYAAAKKRAIEDLLAIEYDSEMECTKEDIIANYLEEDSDDAGKYITIDSGQTIYFVVKE